MENTLNKNLEENKSVEIIRRTIEQTYQVTDTEQLRRITNEIIFAPKTRTISFGYESFSAADLRFNIAEIIENSGNDKTIKQMAHPDSIINMALENLDAKTAVSQEYFHWLNNCADIIKNMNDGFVSLEDLEQRNNFLDTAYQRQNELLTSLGLYAGSENPESAEKINNLRYKLTKLREMISALEKHTRNEPNVQISKAEYEIALPYYKLFKGLTRMSFGYDFSEEQKEELGINHDQDFDLQKSFNYFEGLSNRMLDSLYNGDLNFDPYKYTEEMQEHVFAFRKEEMSDKVKELTRRRKTFRVSYILLEQEKNKHLNA